MALALTACAPPDADVSPALAADGAASDSEATQASALERCDTEARPAERLEAAFATTAGELADWTETRHGSDGPSSSQPGDKWAEDIDVSLCFYRGDDYAPPGPPGRPDADAYTRRVVAVPEAGTAVLMEIGLSTTPIAGPPDSQPLPVDP